MIFSGCYLSQNNIVKKEDKYLKVIYGLFTIILLHVLILTTTDTINRIWHFKIDYPYFLDVFVWAIFYLPFIGFAMLIGFKNYLLKLAGLVITFISTTDIYFFLQDTAGAL